MKIMHCPMNGPRNISEFAWGGEVRAMPDPVTGTDAEWAAYTYTENNSRGIVREWWLHIPTAYWFIAERDTSTDSVLRTYPASALESAAAEPGPEGAE